MKYSIKSIKTNLTTLIGKTVTLQGWLYAKRSSKKVQFLQLRDGTDILQCVVGVDDVNADIFEMTDKLAQETSLIVTGEVRKDDRSPLGFELGVSNVEIIASVTRDYPISPKEHGVAFLMDHRHLWLRSKRQQAILKIRASIITAIRTFFEKEDFTLVDAPILTSNSCEGTSTLFNLEYFGQNAYLTQTGQLYMEAAAMALGKVYCFGPIFRAEKSKTRRHLTEFWMAEPEVAFYKLDDVMDLAEDMLCYIVSHILDTNIRELTVLERDIDALRKTCKPFPRISYDEALEILKQHGKDTVFGKDLGADEETIISKQFDRPVMIHRYPAECKAFYMARDPQNNKLSLGVDVIAPDGYGEIIGGGEREHRLDVLEKTMEEMSIPKDTLEWYLDIRRYGSVPHGGFGVGLERTVAWICDIKHVREAIPFPRTMERLTP